MTLVASLFLSSLVCLNHRRNLAKLRREQQFVYALLKPKFGVRL